MNKTVAKLVEEALELVRRTLRFVPVREPVDWARCKAALWKNVGATENDIFLGREKVAYVGST